MSTGTDDTACSVTSPEGDCLEVIWMAKPIPLCREHALQVAEIIVPDVIAESLRALRTRQSPKTLTPEESCALVDGSRPLDPRDYLDGPHGPVVYVIENGSRVKIGYTTCLRRRVSDLSLRDCNVLLLLEGGPTLERALHTRFAPFRVERTEWFSLVSAIGDFVQAKQDQRGEPPTLVTLSELVARHDLDAAVPEDAAELAEPEPVRVVIEPEAGIAPPPPARLVPRYPDGTEIEAKDAALWQLLGEFGREGAVVKHLAARAKALDHKHNSPPWVRGQLQWWIEKEYVASRKDSREEVFWRTDLRSERRAADGAAS